MIDGDNGGAVRGDSKEEWESDPGATFHMSHTRDGMSNYKKASLGTNVEVADGNVLPVDGFGRIEVDLDQPRYGRLMKLASKTTGTMFWHATMGA